MFLVSDFDASLCKFLYKKYSQQTQPTNQTSLVLVTCYVHGILLGAGNLYKDLQETKSKSYVQVSSASRLVEDS